MTQAGLLALLSHWRRNPIQLFTLIVGLSLATALWSGVQAINAEARASYAAAAETLGEGQFEQITSPSGTIAQADYVALRRAGWLVSPVAEGRFEGIRLIGLDALTAPGGMAPVDLDEGDLTVEALTGGVLFATAETFARLTDTGLRRVVSEQVAQGLILTDVGTAQAVLGMDGTLTRLIVAPQQPVTQPPLDEVAPALTLRPPA